jgi:hypothetical protein
MSTFAQPGRYTYCIGEREEDSPWEPLHVEHGFAASESIVTVQLIRSDVYVEHRSTQEPEEILKILLPHIGTAQHNAMSRARVDGAEEDSLGIAASNRYPGLLAA